MHQNIKPLSDNTLVVSALWIISPKLPVLNSLHSKLRQFIRHANVRGLVLLVDSSRDDIIQHPHPPPPPLVLWDPVRERKKRDAYFTGTLAVNKNIDWHLQDLRIEIVTEWFVLFFLYTKWKGMHMGLHVYTCISTCNN